MSNTIRCVAQRRGRMWIAAVPEFGVYGHGRTLKVLHDNLAGALALAGVPFDRVEIVPTTPELEVLREKRAAYEEAVAEAVAHMAVRRASLRDMAQAVGMTVPAVKRVLAARADLAEKETEEGTGGPVVDPVGFS
jgi:hypothetical protein